MISRTQPKGKLLRERKAFSKPKTALIVPKVDHFVRKRVKRGKEKKDHGQKSLKQNRRHIMTRRRSRGLRGGKVMRRHASSNCWKGETYGPRELDLRERDTGPAEGSALREVRAATKPLPEGSGGVGKVSTLG